MALYRILSFVFALVGLKVAFAIEDYCSVNTFQDGGDGMRLTKEATNEEFAIVGKFKGLHCCAKGYKSIEWFKDGQPYPWGLDLSTLIIFPESANQTIYTQNIKDDDSGNYTCVLRNDRGNETEIYSHMINLKVFDKLPDDPKITYVSQDMEAFAGDNMRLFCEAFGGRIDLPDAHSEAVWLKQLSNGTLIEVPEGIMEMKSLREENQTFGTYLTFSAIRTDDYGTYICVIRKPGNTLSKRVTIREKVKVIEYINPNPFPLREVLILSAVIVLLLTTLLFLVKQYGLKVQVILKDSYGSLEENDGKSSDVMVAYAPKDSELAIGVMVPNLEAKGYHCAARELSTDISMWSQELSRHAQTSRRVVILLSPAALNDTWASSNLYQALKHIQTINASKMITVTLKELPSTQNEAKNSIGETLASVAKSMNVIQWERCNDAKFWLALCKELPAKRGSGNSNGANIEMTSHSRPRLTSERSFDSLVVV
ncbi:unnamed protein product [Ceutorhynchus assimilis]|uniref:Soluble interferon alpha/beta receptor OPG204 n=1 Tax=Ceutorhynchus assimilis TaxID=467358 RepID=A0A9P0DID1_9CUCU|nr:unnamed protein product [Ceutorhynchus assimilis]